MSFRWIEKPRFIDGTGGTDDLTRVYHYQAIGTIHESYARAYAVTATAAVISTTNGTLYRGDIRTTQTAYDKFDVDVSYSSRKQVVGEWDWEFDTTGGTVTLFNSIETVGSYAATGTAPDCKGAINVERDTVKGTEIVIPTMRFSINFKHPLGIITTSYAKFLHDLTGTVNSTQFDQWEAGEVLFLGARGRRGQDSETTVNYSFAMSPNKTNLTIGAVTGVAKLGWHVASIRYKPNVVAGGANNYGIREPEFVYVHRVYDTADLWNALGFA